MSANITIAELIAGISRLTKDHYSLTTSDGNPDELITLSPHGLPDKAVLRLNRIGKVNSTTKTIIVAVLTEKEQVQYLLRWCALSREVLTDPEASDLYAMAIGADQFNSLDECLNFESSESYCRKYMTRPGETVDTLLLRTFLAPTDEKASVGSFSDPFIQALTDTAKDHHWMNAEETEKWGNAFLSGKTGLDLIEILFSDSSKNHQSNLWNI